MEFLRFGSRIAGTYWGCCAIDIIQNFKVDPDAKASIQIVSGDTGMAMGDRYLGPTYRDIFLNRLRIGTHSSTDMPNHAFICALDSSQCEGEIGKKWLAILKEAGFEFIRAVDNSVYSGPSLNSRAYRGPVYIFGLFRNIGKAAVPDPFQPPKAWQGLQNPEKTPEEQYREGKTTFMTAAQLIEAGAPVMKAGTQGEKPRDITEEIKAKTETKATEIPVEESPFLQPIS